MARTINTFAGGAVTDSGSAGFKTDLGVYLVPSPAPTLPSAGGTLTDPVFGTTVMRVTDASTGAGANYGSAYSYWSTFNADNTKIFAYSTDGGVMYIFNFNPATFTLGSKTAVSPPPNGQPLESAIWSATDPDAFFQSGNAIIYKYRPSTGTWTAYADFSSLFSAGTKFKQLSCSTDDDVFGFEVRNSSDVTLGYAAVKKSTLSILYQGVLSDFDEVQVDKSGRYLVIKTGNSATPTAQSAIEVQVADLQASPVTIADLTNGAPDYSPGHSDNGWGIVVGNEDWNDALTRRNLATPHTFTTIFTFGFKFSDKHVSMLANDENWVMVSTDGVSTGHFLETEILFINTNGSGDVRRFLHHQSIVEGTGDRYYTSPRANVTRDGKFVAWTSNWGNASGRLDLFIAKVPSLNSSNAAWRAVGWQGFGLAGSVDVEVDFGVIGDGFKRVSVVGQSWVSDQTKFFVTPIDSADRSVEETALEGVTAIVTNQIAGVGFDLIVAARSETTDKHKFRITGV